MTSPQRRDFSPSSDDAARLTPAMHTTVRRHPTATHGHPEVTHMPEASFPVEVVSGVPIVATPAEIDISNSAGLRAALLEAAAHGNTTLVVDMSQTQFCDSAALNVLVRAHKQAQARHGEVLLVISAATVLRIFAVTGIDHLMPSFPSLHEALAHTLAAPDSTSLPAVLATAPAPPLGAGGACSAGRSPAAPGVCEGSQPPAGPLQPAR
jgi:anti-anti-sigma factor